jgi:hypothetical protein
VHLAIASCYLIIVRVLILHILKYFEIKLNLRDTSDIIMACFVLIYYRLKIAFLSEVSKAYPCPVDTLINFPLVNIININHFRPKKKYVCLLSLAEKK